MRFWLRLVGLGSQGKVLLVGDNPFHGISHLRARWRFRFWNILENVVMRKTKKLNYYLKFGEPY
jgi:hypothetical protein